MKRCVQCGREWPPDRWLCFECGTPLPLIIGGELILPRLVRFERPGVVTLLASARVGMSLLWLVLALLAANQALTPLLLGLGWDVAPPPPPFVGLALTLALLGVAEALGLASGSAIARWLMIGEACGWIIVGVALPLLAEAMGLRMGAWAAFIFVPLALAALHYLNQEEVGAFTSPRRIFTL